MALILFLGVAAVLYAAGSRVLRLLDSPAPEPPPLAACPVCETVIAGTACEACGAGADEVPLYREGGLVLTRRRLVANGRVVRLDRGTAPDVSIVPRREWSDAFDGMSFSLLVAGIMLLVALWNAEAERVVALVVPTVVALAAFPAYLVHSLAEAPQLRYTVRIATALSVSEVYSSSDRERAARLAAEIRRAAS